MNERIRELWEQCKTTNWSIDNPEYDHELFAELIVRECADIATINQHQWHSAGSYVLKHFGFEQ
jgi:hypothetical protein